MELRYYLDWCPVSTLPIHNGIWKADGLTWRSARDIAKPELQSLFKRHRELMMFEFAMRLDGLFVFRIGLLPGASKAAQAELPNELSNFIKGIAGHKHDFHAYPYALTITSVVGWRRICAWCVRGCRYVASRMRLTAAEMRDQLDIDLHIRPVEIENPFADCFKQETRKNFIALHQLVDPGGGDAAIGQLRVLHADGGESAQRACLRLRALFAGKKDRCLIAYHRRRRWLSSLAPAAVYGSIAFSGTFAGLYSYFGVGEKTSIAVAMVAGLAAIILLDDRLQAPKLEVIQRTLGFYAYANIYSMLTETMYRSTPGGPSFNVDTGNFRDLAEALKARLELERQAIVNRKYLWTISFALIATMVALTKLSIEFERITVDDHRNRVPASVVIETPGSGQKGGVSVPESNALEPE